MAEVLQRTRRVESELIAHIGEVDARHLYAEEAYPSMFLYCVRELHLSEAEAYLRIEVARASRKNPELLTMLENGELHLSGTVLLIRHLHALDAEGRKRALARAKHKTKRQIQELIAELAPKPDVPPTIRKLPENSRRSELVPERVGPSDDAEAGEGSKLPHLEAEQHSPKTETEPGPNVEKPSEAEPKRKHVNVEPLSPARYKVTFTASSELRDKLDRLSALMPGADLASMIESAVSEKLTRLEAKRFGKTKRPKKKRTAPGTVQDSSYIAAAVRREVSERDGYRCTFVAKNGRRCPARHNLEFHHHKPRGLGGGSEAENLSLRCRAHNFYAAEQDYGEEKMRRYRRDAADPDRVSEPMPGWQLGPDGVDLDLALRTNETRRRATPRNCPLSCLGEQSEPVPRTSLGR